MLRSEACDLELEWGIKLLGDMGLLLVNVPTTENNCFFFALKH
jgi:hypothetical protein